MKWGGYKTKSYELSGWLIPNSLLFKEEESL
jgi:hypothetical protein